MTIDGWMHGLSAVLVVGLLAGCSSGDDDATGDGDAGTGGGSAGSGEPSASGPLYGPFNVELKAAIAVGAAAKPRPAQTAVSGLIRDGVQPRMDGWETLDEVGDCALLTPDPPSCDPRCVAGKETCAPGDMCLPIPNKRSAGKVTVTGLGEPIELEDKVAGNYALPNGLVVPYPPCSEGEPITFDIEGTGHDPFMLQVPCVATFEAPEPVAIEAHTPIELRWAAPTMPELTTLHVHLNVAHHGGIDSEIECDTADDGELEIDAALIDGLINIGVAGFPTVVLTRSASASGSDETSENVTLTVSSSYESPVMIPGVISCTTDAECPDGQACGTDLRCL